MSKGETSLFKDGVVLVTGGASGLGLACVERFAKHGMKVVAADLPTASTSELKLLGNQVEFVPVDVSSEADVTRLMDHVKQKQGKLHILVNCAGITHAEPVYDFKADKAHDINSFLRVLTINTVGTFNVVRLAAGIMGKNEPDHDGQRGVIVNIASTLAIEGIPCHAAYCASKAAIIGMTLPLARDLGEVGVRVVTIAPGLMDTPMVANMPYKDAILDKYVGFCAFPQRLGRPAELAQLVQSIAENTMINGEVIRLDGGGRN